MSDKNEFFESLFHEEYGTLNNENPNYTGVQNKYFLAKEFFFKGVNHQQKKIDKLEEQLRGERQATKTFSEHLNNERVRHGSTEKKLQAAEEEGFRVKDALKKSLTINTLLFNDLLEYQDESNKPLSDEFKVAQEMLNGLDGIRNELEEEFLKDVEE